jgi:hypothetical protein
MSEKLTLLLIDLYRTFGWKTKIMAPVTGRYILTKLKQEKKRLTQGWTYEPRSFHEKNAAALALEKKGPSHTRVAIPETPRPVPDHVPAHGR